MHYEQQQRRRRFMIFLFEIVILFGAVGYIGFNMKAMDELQDQRYQELQESLSAVTGAYHQSLEEIKGYDAKLNNMAQDIRREYSSGLMELAQETEEKSEVQLQELKQELKVASGDFTELADIAVKGAVSITTEAQRGSGAIISREGYIVTNNHVIKNSETAQVKDYTGRILVGQVIATDPVRDLAIIKVPTLYEQSLPLGDSDSVKVGEMVIAIGSPERLDLSVTQGIVSANNRVFHKDEGSFIQTDVPINTGSSGGPLINARGELIGINTFKIKGSESLGFAIPAKDVKIIFDASRS